MVGLSHTSLNGLPSQSCLIQFKSIGPWINRRNKIGISLPFPFFRHLTLVRKEFNAAASRTQTCGVQIWFWSAWLLNLKGSYHGNRGVYDASVIFWARDWLRIQSSRFLGKRGCPAICSYQMLLHSDTKRKPKRIFFNEEVYSCSHHLLFCTK